MEPKCNLIELSTFLKYGLIKVKKHPSQMFDLVLTMPQEKQNLKSACKK